MFKIFLLILATTGLFACSSSPNTIASSISTIQNKVEPVTDLEPVSANASVQQNKVVSFEEAASRGMSAAAIATTSRSKEDWKLVAQTWQEAITLMQSVPNTSSNYAVSQKKIAEYQRNLVYANKQAVKPVPKATTIQPIIQQASFSSASAPLSPSVSTTVVSRQMPTVLPSTKVIASKPKQSTVGNSGRTPEASVKAFMNDYFDQTINKGNKGLTSWCAKTFSLASSLYSPESAKILDTWVSQKGRIASVKARIESSNGGGSPVRKNWTFYLAKDDTYFEKQMLKEGSSDSYKYSKSKYGGWCIQMLTEI